MSLRMPCSDNGWTNASEASGKCNDCCVEANAIDAGPPGFGRSTATSIGVQQTEGDENEMGNILQEITEMEATTIDGGRRHVISSCKNITIGMECARARNVTVKHENDEDSCRQPRVLDIDGECARKLQKELDEEFGK